MVQFLLRLLGVKKTVAKKSLTDQEIAFQRYQNHLWFIEYRRNVLGRKY